MRKQVIGCSVLAAALAACPALAAVSVVTAPFTGTKSPYSFFASAPASNDDFSIVKTSSGGIFAPTSSGLNFLVVPSVTLKLTLASPATEFGFTTKGFNGDTVNLTSVTFGNGDTLATTNVIPTGNLTFWGLQDDNAFTTVTMSFSPKTANSVTLSDFRFLTSTVVPEPASLGMFGVAATAGGALLRRRVRHA